MFPPKGTGKSYDYQEGEFPDFGEDDVGVWFGGNLDANCKIFEQYDDGSGTTSTTLEDGQELSRIEPQEAIARDTTFTVFDELGGRHQVRIAFIKTAPNVWNVCVIDDEGKIQGDPHEIEFDSSTGKLINGDTLDLEV